MPQVTRRKSAPRLLVITDLDGTLMDHETYSYADAEEALKLLNSRKIPLILCSSKTRAEIEPLRATLGVKHPFICENGGAVAIPRNYFSSRPQGSRRTKRYDIVQFGKAYAELVSTLRRVSGELGVRVRGFSTMTAQEVAREAGLPVSEARLAKKREYDEPFRVLDSGAAPLRSLLAALRRTGLRCVRGGRFHHLTGVTDKGLAVRTLKSIYEREWGPVRSMGLGDGLNDAPLLRAVDIPVIVLNPTSGATAQLQRQVPNAILTRAPGPRGWNQAVLAEAGRRSPK